MSADCKDDGLANLEHFVRCMATRRDIPMEKLWKTAANAFISVLRGALISDTPNIEHQVAQESLVASGTIRSRFWKEVVDVYEKFMVGACGRAVSLPVGVTIKPEILDAEELLENRVLCFLSDELLTSCQDAPREVWLSDLKWSYSFLCSSQ